MNKISTLRKILKEKREEKRDIIDGIYSDSLVVKARKAYDDAMELYRSNTKSKCELLEKEIVELDKQIDDLANKKELDITQETNEFLRKLCGGMDWGSKGFVIKWVSASNRFIMATNGGHHYWSGRGTTSYAQSHHYLFDIKKIGSASHGMDVSRNCKVFECEGRLSKETMNQWKEYATKEENNV